MGKFVIWCPEDDGQNEDDGEGETIDIPGISMEDACIEWAREKDENTAEYSIVSGEEKTVFVREVGDEKKHCFRVWGEVVPQYYAKYIEV